MIFLGVDVSANSFLNVIPLALFHNGCVTCADMGGGGGGKRRYCLVDILSIDSNMSHIRDNQTLAEHAKWKPSDRTVAAFAKERGYA